MAKKVEENDTPENANKEELSKMKCGIVMPISGNDRYSSMHWSEILSILKEVAQNLEFECELVSESDVSHIIQTRIVHNLYDNEIVICDVSGNNPNVMFELGMRLAFDKPTIVVKDTKTENYNFDISPIQHLIYPTDKNYYQIQLFQEKLKNKLEAFITAHKKGEKFSTYLEAFGKLKVAKIDEKEGSLDQVLLTSLDEIKKLLASQCNTPRTQNIEGLEFMSNELYTQLVREIRRMVDQFLMNRPSDITQKYSEGELLRAIKNQYYTIYSDMLNHFEVDSRFVDNIILKMMFSRKKNK